MIYIALLLETYSAEALPAQPRLKRVIWETYKKQVSLAEASIAGLVEGHSRWTDPQLKRLGSVDRSVSSRGQKLPPCWKTQSSTGSELRDRQCCSVIEIYVIELRNNIESQVP